MPWPTTVPSTLGLAVRREAAERPPVALRDPPLPDGRLDGRVEIEEAKGVGDRGTRLADAIGDLLLGQAELVDQLAVGEGLVDRIEVGPLDVLHERDLELVAVRQLADQRRDPVETGQAGGADATLPGDQLVAVERLGDEHRLEHAVLADARREVGEFGVVPVVARLVRDWG